MPEIVDLNVLPKFQQQGIGSRLMDEVEETIKQEHNFVGIGVGLAPGYNAAQRMYVLRGYVPDGLGIRYNNNDVSFGQKIIVDDNLELYLIKKLN